MRDKHIFSPSYTARKEAVMNALRREETAEKNSHTCSASRIPLKILACAALLSVLTVSVYAAVQWIEFRLVQDGDETRIHASLNETGDTSADREEKPPRSWNAEEGEISVRLLIPDLPSDMRERENTNGKYYSDDTSRGMTVNGIDLRRSDLDQIIGGNADIQQIDAGGKPMYVIKGHSEAAYYNRTAYILLEEEELVLKFWVSYGITDEELLAMASTLTLEETNDPWLALPISNEVSDDSFDWTTPIVIERDPIYEADLLEIGESARAANDWYTATVNRVEIHDNIHVLNRHCITRKDYVESFIDDSGKLIPYTRTEKILVQDGQGWALQYGEDVSVTKKLYVVTLTMEDVTIIPDDEAANEEMLKACVNGFNLNGYTISDGKVEMTFIDAAVNRKPESHSGNGEGIYREYLGNNQWKIAFLIDSDTSAGDLVLYDETCKIYVKIQ